ncbi:MAG: 16S rRNA (cytosine(1402)-N(4))-methyltransferase RsmH [Verrucomicrobiae bacterium]|nr:16S rRNA (cytosine(1402)-N(4))-methyltransferase RsmH [Verrucomicrobiae bacterium]
MADRLGLSMNYHTPVLLEEVVRQLQPRSGGWYLDATVGDGGHAEAILRASAPEGRLIGLDWDEEAIEVSRVRLASFGARVQLVAANYARMRTVLSELRVAGVDGVLFDLGVSSRQVDEPSRGFSFLRDGPLDMRMDRRSQLTAAEVLARASEGELARIFFEYGEERRSRAIARYIVRRRQRERLGGTAQLVRWIEAVVGEKPGAVHPSVVRVFQALRIYVNGELDNLGEGLAAAEDVLRCGGRLVVISFHSLEDRVVKWFLRGAKRLRVLTKKPVAPGAEERERNPRCRSAKLRAAEKI